VSITTFAVTDKLRVYVDGRLVAEIPPHMFPPIIAGMGDCLIGKVPNQTPQK